MSRVGVAAVVALAACGEAGDGARDASVDAVDAWEEPACDPRLGDLTAPVQIEALTDGVPDGRVLHDGDDIALVVPPQGGIILLAGVRARNVDGCQLQLDAGLRDPVSGQLLTVESRPIQLRRAADGWGVPVDPQLFSLANLAVCPATASTRDVVDQPWRIELTVTDRGRQASTAVTVTPRCGGEACRCLCTAGVDPGTCPIAGAFDGGLPDPAADGGVDAR